MRLARVALASTALIALGQAGNSGETAKCPDNPTQTVYSTVEKWSVSSYTVTVTDTITIPTTIIQPVTVPTTIPTTITKPVTVPITIPTTITQPITVPITVVTTILVTVTDTVKNTVQTTIVNDRPVTVTTFITSVNAVTATRTTSITSVSVALSTVTTTVVDEVTGPTTTVSVCPTAPLVGLVTCTSRIINPTYTPPAPLPSNYLWGCPPDTLCTPPQIGCNFEKNLPADSYFCAPEECKPTPPLPSYKDLIDYAPNTNTSCAWYTPIPGYFNLNPEYFGLTFDIFDIYGQPVCAAAPPSSNTLAPTWADWTSPTSSGKIAPTPRSVVKAKRQLNVAPAVCYPLFNAAALEGEAAGHEYDRLCLPENPFQIAVQGCISCANGASASGDAGGIENTPELQDFVDWCHDNAPPTKRVKRWQAPWPKPF